MDRGGDKRPIRSANRGWVYSKLSKPGGKKGDRGRDGLSRINSENIESRIQNPGVKHLITAVCQKSEPTILRSLDGARPILFLDLRLSLLGAAFILDSPF